MNESTVWFIMIWSIWKYRNDIILKNKSCVVLEIFALVQVKSWIVIKTKFREVSLNYSDRCIDPIQYIIMSFAKHY